VTDVVVIGAGAAGLAAAHDLAKRSFRVVVIEARDRIGGRVCSIGVKDGVAELGAEFIHGQAEDTMALLRHIGSSAIPISDEAWKCSKRGELEREGDNFMSAARIFDASRDLADDESVDEFLRPYERDSKTREAAVLARRFVEGFDAADPEIASAIAIADEWRSGTDFSSARPAGGYRPVFEHLAKSCGDAGVQLNLSATVQQIAWDPYGVTVDAKTESGDAQTFRARAAIVTVPVGILQRDANHDGIKFEPDLPSAKYAALRSIEMGHAVRVVLWFRTGFWEEITGGRYRDAAFFRCEGQPFHAYWTQLPTRNTQVVAWAGGPQAIAMGALSQQARIEFALERFGRLFNEVRIARDEFESGATHDWSQDPNTRGAYSYVAVGGGDARAILGAPIEDRLFFAGEATATDGQGGTVSGALKTGKRAAQEVATAFA